MKVSETRLKREYRKESNQVMEQCINDAKQVTEKAHWDPQEYATIVAAAAQSLYETRISPFHYWKQRRKTELMEQGDQ